MKIFILISLLITGNLDIWGQTKFPFTIGNKWQYLYSTWDGAGNGTRDTVYGDMLFDSTFGNGYEYTYFNSSFYSNKFFREDSFGLHWYDTDAGIEWLAYKYSLPIDSFIYIGYPSPNPWGGTDTAKVFKRDQGYITLFGDTTFIMAFEYIPVGWGEGSFTITLSQKYGFIWFRQALPGYSLEIIVLGCIIDGVPYGTFVDVNDPLPSSMEYSLFQNYPNPFNPVTTIRYSISKPEKVSVKVYDLLGREVALLLNDEQTAGYHEVKFDASNLASGTYIYRIVAGDFVQSRKMILMK